mmetsp:Transcript_99226/g.258703  ORF Transcript_99226/g.258703 Transcript_99226/m.258703 type:complete len:205 (-) Transcript_99226:181-795(-)
MAFSNSSFTCVRHRVSKPPRASGAFWMALGSDVSSESSKLYSLPIFSTSAQASLVFSASRDPAVIPSNGPARKVSNLAFLPSASRNAVSPAICVSFAAPSAALAALRSSAAFFSASFAAAVASFFAVCVAAAASAAASRSPFWAWSSSTFACADATSPSAAVTPAFRTLETMSAAVDWCLWRSSLHVLMILSKLPASIVSTSSG